MATSSVAPAATADNADLTKKRPCPDSPGGRPGTAAAGVPQASGSNVPK